MSINTKSLFSLAIYRGIRGDEVTQRVSTMSIRGFATAADSDLLRALTSSLAAASTGAPGGRLAIALSGGTDSTALAIVARQWWRQRHAARREEATAAEKNAEKSAEKTFSSMFAEKNDTPPLMLTVDHRLRPESSGEARQAAAIAAHLGFEHETLRVHWGACGRAGKVDGGGTGAPAVASGSSAAPAVSKLQAAARWERYRLLHDACAERGISTLLVAHHRNDQIETFMHRLARQSGLFGLRGMDEVSAAMRPTGGAQPEYGNDADGHGENARRTAPPLCHLHVVRPFLHFPRTRMESIVAAYADQSGVSFPPCIDDPSNENSQFDRVRIRKALRGDEVGRAAVTLPPLASPLGPPTKKQKPSPPALDHQAIATLMSSIRVAATSMQHDARDLFAATSNALEPFGCVGLDLTALFPKQYAGPTASALPLSKSIVAELVVGVISMAVERVRHPVAWPPPRRSSLVGMYHWIRDQTPVPWHCRAVAGIMGTVFRASDVRLAVALNFDPGKESLPVDTADMLVFHPLVHTHRHVTHANFVPIEPEKELVWGGKYGVTCSAVAGTFGNRSFGMAPLPRGRYSRDDRSISRMRSTMGQDMPGIYEKVSRRGGGQEDGFVLVGAPADLMGQRATPRRRSPAAIKVAIRSVRKEAERRRI